MTGWKKAAGQPPAGRRCPRGGSGETTSRPTAPSADAPQTPAVQPPHARPSHTRRASHPCWPPAACQDQPLHKRGHTQDTAARGVGQCVCKPLEMASMLFGQAPFDESHWCAAHLPPHGASPVVRPIQSSKELPHPDRHLDSHPPVSSVHFHNDWHVDCIFQPRPPQIMNAEATFSSCCSHTDRRDKQQIRLVLRLLMLFSQATRVLSRIPPLEELPIGRPSCGHCWSVLCVSASASLFGRH
mmetsp:Transcript_34386/g.99024  ORF Transcript_34386/g.99024 Transcript_34386/m.99024 type:complete len:242 (+) Transcript_34386:1694-2419(+)